MSDSYYAHSHHNYHRIKEKANLKAGNESQRKAPRKVLKRRGSSHLVQKTPAQAQTDPDQSRNKNLTPFDIGCF